MNWRSRGPIIPFNLLSLANRSTKRCANDVPPKMQKGSSALQKNVQRPVAAYCLVAPMNHSDWPRGGAVMDVYVVRQHCALPPRRAKRYPSSREQLLATPFFSICCIPPHVESINTATTSFSMMRLLSDLVLQITPTDQIDRPYPSSLPGVDSSTTIPTAQVGP